MATTPLPFVLDLDGVLWLADRPIPGAADAAARLHDAGHPVAFVTNNSNPTVADLEAKLTAQGIRPDISAGAVMTSATATAALIEPGERVLVCGGPGLREALAARGADIATDGEADVVAVGFHREFDYERMRIAAAAVRRGARLIASNDDATYPTPDGPIPGNGAILAGIVTASGTQPVAIAGKPHEPMANLIRERFGREGIVVGDRADTDGRFARALGWHWALVLSGVTTAADLPVEPEPDLVAPDLAAVVEVILGSEVPGDLLHEPHDEEIL